MLVRKFLRIFIVFKIAFKSLRGNDPLRMGAATAFFAFFALPAISIILSKVLSVLFHNNDRVVSAKLFDQLAEIFGSQSAHQLENISENLQEIPQSPFFTLFGVLFLILSATTLFAVIKGSLNQLFNIKGRNQYNRAKFFRDRAIGLGIILFSGLLFILSLVSEVLVILLQEQLQGSISQDNDWMVSMVNHIISLAILTLWFAILFKYLPDIKIRWKAIFIGAFLTGIFYKAGAFILEMVLIEGQIGVIFGTSASIVLILLFIFYSSLIFYYGAAFIRAYAEFARLAAQPKSHAIAYQITEIEVAKS